MKTIFNKQEIIRLFLTEIDPEHHERMSIEFARISRDEFNEIAKTAGFNTLENYWTMQNIFKKY